MNLVGISDQKGGGFSCGVQCPAEECGKMIGCIYKSYTRKAQKNKEECDSKKVYRKPQWYFPNLKTHLMKHQETLEPITESLLSISPSFTTKNTGSADGFGDVDDSRSEDNFDDGSHSNDSKEEEKCVNESRFNLTNMSVQYGRSTPEATHSTPLLSNKPQTTSRISMVQIDKSSKVKSLINRFNASDVDSMLS